MIELNYKEKTLMILINYLITLKNSFLCASTHKSDLRELVPEIYYFPELFINDFDFGNVINDSNETIRVHNVLLPV